ncbi:hypothetical protein [Streptomyces sp. 3N207]|uniref:hypothetical protein n=1 Tax=Streptomyces sp. 3N207 TaxID=3457417 RepID=UPI003FD20514
MNGVPMAKTMMSYRDLSELKFATLDAAIKKWKSISKEFGDISTGEGDGADVPTLEARAKSANWSGVGATRGKEFVTEVASEFHDAARSAKSIYRMIKLSRTRMHKHQADLHKLVEDAKGVIVQSDGSITATQCYEDEAEQKAADRKVDALKREIEKILLAAARTEHNLAEALRLLVKSPHDFSGADYDSYEDARKAVGKADADKAVDLAKELSKGAENGDISPTKLAKLNDLALLQRTNPAYAERFATQMEAKGILQFWRMMPGDGIEVKADSTQGKELARLRDNLGMTLATASREKSSEMMAWKQDLINLGGKPIGRPGQDLPNGPFGFQVMGSLMGKGKFDTDFLRDYEKELRTFDKAHGKGREWSLAMNQNTDLDPARQGERSADPMTGFLKAASHNPEFATELLKDKEAADYYLTDRAYEPEDAFEGSKNRGAEALGDALFAAGSGMNPDDTDAKFVEHRPEHDAVFKGALNRLAAKGDDMMPELRDDMAKLMGNHGDDVHKSMSDPLGGGPLDERKLLEVSKQVSRDPEGYALLNESMNRAMVHDIMSAPESDPTGALRRTGHTIGFLEEARFQAVDDKKAADNREASWKSTVGFISVAAPAASFLPTHAANVVDRVAWMTSKAWQFDEEDRIANEATLSNQSASELRDRQLRAYSDLWYDEHKSFARTRTPEGQVMYPDYNEKEDARARIAYAADHGGIGANREAGEG